MSSEQLRNEGNKILSSISDGLPPVIQVSRLEKAITTYRNALEKATSQSDRASALKNIGVASMKVAKVLSIKHEFLRVRYYLKETMESYSNSYYNGQSVKSIEWLIDIEEKMCTSFDAIEEIVEGVPFDKKMIIMEECAYSANIESVRAKFCLRIAQLFYHQALFQLNVKNHVGALTSSNDCYRPMEEASRYGKYDEYICSEIRILKEDLLFLTCRGESLQALSTGMILHIYLVLDF